MRLGGRRQQVLPGLLIYIESTVDHIIHAGLEESREAADGEVPGDDLAEDGDKDVVVELGDRQRDEVPFEARRDVATGHGRTHRAHELDVYQFDGHHVFHVVPGLVIQPLAQQLDRWLRAEHLLLRHRHVIHEDHPVLAGRRTVQTFVGNNLLLNCANCSLL